MSDTKTIVLVNLHGDVVLDFSTQAGEVSESSFPQGYDIQELLTQSQLCAETFLCMALNELCERQSLNTVFVTGTPLEASDLN